MNIRVIRVDLAETNAQLKRIADLLEGILGATEPLNPAQLADFPEEKGRQRIFYTNDAEEIVAHKLAQIGKEYKSRTTQK